MKIVSLENDPLLEIPFLNAGRGPGSFYVDKLPIHLATVDELPASLDAIIATADLQGRERLKPSATQAPRLLGEVLPSQLAESILPELGIAAERCGVILAGDFYTVPALDKRGGSGDVIDVWNAFGDEFDWVAGVAGNHDTFGESTRPSRATWRNCHYLDATRTQIHSLQIAGLGGIIGNTRRPHRRSVDDYVDRLSELLIESVDILISHDGPDRSELGLRGSPAVREALELLCPPLVIRGHAHWDPPLTELAGGTQVLNVDARVAILKVDR